MKKWLSSLKSSFRQKDIQKTQETESFLLVEGMFSPAEAADVLLSLINDKVKFHTVQLLNLNESNGEDSLNSKNRIQQLKQAKQEITETILEARNQGNLLKIHSTIEISIIAPSA
ncbi:MAG: hypothetical protein AB3N18_18935 [Allomuricauda sp.]